MASYCDLSLRSVEQEQIEPYADLLVVLFELLITPKAKLDSQVRKIAPKANNLELKNLTKEEIRRMLGIEKELLRETVFYKEVFEEDKQEGKVEGKYLTKRAMVPLLQE